MEAAEELTAQDRIRLKGRREGIVRAKSETLKRQIRETFGSLPGELESHIDEQPEAVIDEYLDCLLWDATTVSAAPSAAKNR